MAKLNRTTAKVFGVNASPADNATSQGPEIGQFGSALAGTYNGTADIATIQSLPAWSQGFIGAVTPTNQYPPLPEMTGFGKVLSYQTAYLYQQGIPEWDSNTEYYANGFCSKGGNIYISNTNANINNDPENDQVNWRIFENGGRSHNLFDVVIKDHVLNYDDTLGFTIQGGWAYKEALAGEYYGYPTFYAKCIAERDAGTQTLTTLGSNQITTYNNSNGHIYFNIADKAAVDTYFNTYGVAWYYGIDEENERILMPRNNYFFRNATSNPGGLNLPGAPDIAHTHTRGSMNITGTFGRFYNSSVSLFNASSTSGAFSLTSPGRYAAWSAGGGVNDTSPGITFNAANAWTGTTSTSSTSNSIYGRETNQIMVTSSNGILYIVTGNTVDEHAITLNASLQNAIDAIEEQEQTSIGNVQDAGDEVLDDISDAKDAAIEDIQDETSSVISDATAQADRAEDEADRAEAAANIAVAGQMQADWTQNDPDKVDYIKNKPTGLVTETATQTLTNKTIDGLDNTLQNLTVPTFASSSIANSVSELSYASSNKFTTEYGVADALEPIRNQINDLQIAKNPNLSIIGDLTISSGNVSSFTAADYLQFPYVWNFGGYSWELVMQLTTSSDVTTQQNIIDSYYGIAVAINNGNFVLSISSNGTSWDIANSSTGTYTVEGETVYTLKLSWDGSDYKLAYSLDGVDFTDDITVTSSTVHEDAQEYVGGSPNLFGTGTAHPFDGTINLNKWSLKVNDLLVWLGMDDVGLSSRANVSLNNLDELGEARFDNLQAAINTKEAIAKAINTLSTSGTIALTDNSINSITPSAAVTFTLPTVTDNTVFHQILVQVNLSTVYSIDLGLGATPHYFNKTAPDMSNVGVYNLYFEYDKANQYWVCGCIEKGAAS